MTHDTEIACTLTDAQFRERRVLIRKTVLAHVVKRHRNKSGITLTFPCEDAIRSQVENFVDLERQCCGFLTFTLSPQGGDLELLIEAPEAGQQMLDQLADAVSAHD